MGVGVRQGSKKKVSVGLFSPFFHPLAWDVSRSREHLLDALCSSYLSAQMLALLPVESLHRSELRSYLLCLSLECLEIHVMKHVALESQNASHIAA